MYRSIIRTCFFILALMPACLLATRSMTLNTRYGIFEITEPVIIELIEHPMFKRLEHVRQYGADYYTRAPLQYTRYEHSIGVFAILRRYNASLTEQIAGLLHDSSHTVFSHVGDWLFGTGDNEHSFQDDHHEQFLKESGLADILEKHGYTIADIHHKNKHFMALEQPLPNLCADRIEYNLSGGIIEGIIHENDVEAILQALKFDGKNWYFTDMQRACQFAHCPLFMTEHVWSSSHGMLSNVLCARLLRHALDHNTISLNDVLYGTDDKVWQDITATPAAEKLVEELMNHATHFVPCTASEAEFSLKAKFRGVNPWIKTADGHLKRLTDIHDAYRTSYERVAMIFASDRHFKRCPDAQTNLTN